MNVNMGVGMLCELPDLPCSLKIWREGAYWYMNKHRMRRPTALKWEKMFQCRHLTSGNPNLPPTGQGWAACSGVRFACTPGPTSIHTAIHPNFQETLQRITKTPVGLLKPPAPPRFYLTSGGVTYVVLWPYSMVASNSRALPSTRSCDGDHYAPLLPAGFTGKVLVALRKHIR